LIANLHEGAAWMRKIGSLQEFDRMEA
jgi:hypothetical protein